MNLSEPELAEARKEFEISLLFDKYQLMSGPGSTRRSGDMYDNVYIEAAWRGFLMCWERQHDLLDRLDPMRYIGPGLIGAYKEVSEYDHSESEDEWIHDEIRAALTACRSTPV